MLSIPSKPLALAIATLTFAAPPTTASTQANSNPLAPPLSSQLFTLRTNSTEPGLLPSPFTTAHIQDRQLGLTSKGASWENVTQFADGCQGRAGFSDPHRYWAPIYFWLNTSRSETSSSSFTASGMGAEPRGPTLMSAYGDAYGLHVGGNAERDAQGRRAVGVGEVNCGTQLSRGFYIDVDAASGVEIMKYDDGEEEEGFGSWYTCDDAGDFGYGPALFYRCAGEKHPTDCADVNLVPECSEGVGYVAPPNTANATCYGSAKLGGN